MADVNSLYQDLQDKQKAYNDLNGKVAKNAADLPAYATAKRQDIFGNNPELPVLRNTYADAVQELFNYDKEAAARYSDPTSNVFIEDPYARAKAVSSGVTLRGNIAESAYKTYAAQKDILGKVLENALLLQEAKNKGDEIAMDNAKYGLDNAIKLYTSEADREVEREKAKLGTVSEQKVKAVKERAASQIADGMTLADAIDLYKDQLTADEIKQLYDENTKRGPRKENDSEVNRMYQSAKKGAGAYDTFAALSNTEEKAAREKVSAVVQSSNLLNTLASKMGNRAPEFWSALVSGDVGKLAQLTSPFRNDQTLKSEIEAFEAGIRQQVYGSAFTETEAKLAKQWLASGSDQANEVWVKLFAQNKSNLEKLKISLGSAGFSPEEINRNLERSGYRPVSTTSPSSSLPSAQDYANKYFPPK